MGGRERRLLEPQPDAQKTTAEFQAALLMGFTVENKQSSQFRLSKSIGNHMIPYGGICKSISSHQRPEPHSDLFLPYRFTFYIFPPGPYLREQFESLYILLIQISGLYGPTLRTLLSSAHRLVRLANFSLPDTVVHSGRTVLISVLSV